MSRRAKQPAAGSRRTRRAEQQPQPPPADLADDSPKIVSNPIFRCEAGPSQPKPPAADHLVGCVYRSGSLYALVHDPAAAAAADGIGIGTGKPLPLPPCRAHRAAGSHVPASRSGPMLAGAGGGPHGRVVRSGGGAPKDPFLAAYVACSKNAAGGEDAAGADRHQRKLKQGKKKRRSQVTKRKGKQGEEIARGCGILSGAMSCRYGCVAVAESKSTRKLL